MPDTEVTPQGAQPSGADDKSQGGSGKDEVRLSRAEFESLRRERDEARESEKFWATRARAGNTADQTVDEPEEIDTSDLVPEVTGVEGVDQEIFNNPDKWADAISKGPQAIQAFIKKAGYVTGTEVADIARKVADRLIQAERGKMTSDATIMRDFPELADNKSDLWKATAAELQTLTAIDPSARKSPATLYAAARTAKAQLDAKKAGAGRRGDRNPEDDNYDRFEDDEPEPEADRQRRADSQDGSRRNARDADDRSDMLGDQARLVMKEMGVSEEDFLAERKKLGGGGARSRGRR